MTGEICKKMLSKSDKILKLSFLRMILNMTVLPCACSIDKLIYSMNFVQSI